MSDLAEYREEIDAVDAKLLKLLAERAEISRKIGQLKKDEDQKPLAASRWTTMLQDRLSLAEELNLDRQYVSELWSRIHDQSLYIQAKES